LKTSLPAPFAHSPATESDYIINGTTDWVYEEELSLRDGFRWSPDSRQIAYWQFDTHGVANFDLNYDLGAPGEIVTGFPYPGTGRYPTHLSLPYPIAGTTNSAVRIGTVSATGGKTHWIPFPATLARITSLAPSGCRAPTNWRSNT